MTPQTLAAVRDTGAKAPPHVLTGRAETRERALALVPHLRERAARTEADRMLSRETVDDLVDSGLFGIMTPRMFGGSALGFAAMVEAATILGSGCGSTGWVFGVLSTHAWMLTQFPPDAQREVFADPRALIATVFRCDGQSQKAAGGYRLLDAEGSFCSGIDHSSWVILGNTAPQGDGAPPEQCYFLVPAREMQIVDDWKTVGMRGTGSRTIRAQELFIPEHRCLLVKDTLSGAAPGRKLHTAPLFQAPFNYIPPLGLVGPALGCGQAAVRLFAAALKNKLAGVDELQAAEQSATFVRLSQAAAEVDAAVALILRDAELVDAGPGPDGAPRISQPTLSRDVAYAGHQCRIAVTTLFEGGGGHSVYDGSELQRAWRDVNTLTAHLAFSWDSAATNFGRASVGLPVKRFALKKRSTTST